MFRLMSSFKLRRAHLWEHASLRKLISSIDSKAFIKHEDKLWIHAVESLIYSAGRQTQLTDILFSHRRNVSISNSLWCMLVFIQASFQLNYIVGENALNELLSQ